MAVNAPGFAPYEATNVSVAVGQNVNLTPRLEVNTSKTTVEVTTEAPTVDSTRTDVSQVIGTQQIQDLPSMSGLPGPISSPQPFLMKHVSVGSMMNSMIIPITH